MDGMPAMPAWLQQAVGRAIARWVPPLVGVDAADYRQEALVAWWQASQHYEATQPATLGTYSRKRVLGRVKDVRSKATTEGQMRYLPLEAWQAVTPPRAREVWLWRRINRLPRLERTIVIRVYWSGWTLARLGRALGVSEARVCQLRQQALRRLRQALAEPAEVL